MYISLITKEHLNGRVAITTDRLGGFRTGHGTTPTTFWSNLLRWTSKSLKDESVYVGVVKNVETYYENYLNSLSGVAFKEISTEYLERFGADEFDVVYFIGLPLNSPDSIPDLLETYVAGGGGLIFESPDIEGEIELLSSIDSIEVASTARPTQDLASWTNFGVSSDIYTPNMSSSFMVTINQSDLPEEWNVELSDIPTSKLPENNDEELSQFNYDSNAIQEFGVSFVTGMKDGLVTLEPGDALSISESSSDSSSSSSTLLETEWDLCDDMYAYWKLNEDNANSFVWDSSGDFSQMGTFKSNGSNELTSNRSTIGKVNNALRFKASEENNIEIPSGTKLNFTNGTVDTPFSVCFWVYPLNPSGPQTIISKNNVWSVSLVGAKVKAILTDGANTRSVESLSTLSINKWSFIVVTYDGSTLKTYVNAVNDSGVQSDVGYVSMDNLNSISTIGSDASSDWMDGLIDNLLVVNKEVNSLEMEGMWNMGRGTEECSAILAFTSSSDSSSSSIDSSSSSSSEGYSSSSSEGYSSSSSSSSEGYSSSSSDSSSSSQ